MTPKFYTYKLFTNSIGVFAWDNTIILDDMNSFYFGLSWKDARMFSTRWYLMAEYLAGSCNTEKGCVHRDSLSMSE